MIIFRLSTIPLDPHYILFLFTLTLNPPLYLIPYSLDEDFLMLKRLNHLLLNLLIHQHQQKSLLFLLMMDWLIKRLPQFWLYVLIVQLHCLLPWFGVLSPQFLTIIASIERINLRFIIHSPHCFSQYLHFIASVTRFLDGVTTFLLTNPIFFFAGLFMKARGSTARRATRLVVCCAGLRFS